MKNELTALRNELKKVEKALLKSYLTEKKFEKLHAKRDELKAAIFIASKK